MAGGYGKFACFAVALLAVFTTMPLFQPYFFASSDGLFHLYRLMEYDAVLSEGVLYPRWAPDFFFSMGLPIFNYYAPLTYYLGEVFHLLGAGYVDSLRLLVAGAMALSGVGAYLYARTMLSPLAAAAVGVVYEYVPYHLVNLYYRGDLAEYLAYTWYPLVLWALARLVQTRRLRYLLAGSASYAALILTHNLSAFIFSGFLPIYAAAALLRQQRVANGLGTGRAEIDSSRAGQELWGAVARMIAMAAVAVGLTAFFWLPALAERSLLSFDRLLLHYDFREHFPSVQQLLSADILHRYGVVFRGADVYGYRLGLLQAVFLVAGSALLAVRYRHLAGALRIEAVASLLVAVLAFFFIFPMSLPLWDRLPLLNLTQFPWRFLAFIALPSALLAGLIVEACAQRWRWVVAGILVPLVIASSVARLTPIMSNVTEGDVSPLGSLEFELSYGAIGTSAASEYLPRWVKSVPASSATAFEAVVGKPAASPAGRVPAGMTVTQLERRAISSAYRVQSDRGGDFVPNLLSFPGWSATIDGRPAETRIDDPTGLIAIAVPPGDHLVGFRFEDTLVQRASEWLSGVTLMVALAWVGVEWRRGRRARTRDRGESEPASARRGPRASAARLVATRTVFTAGVLLAWLGALAIYNAGIDLAPGRWTPLVANLDNQVLIQGYELAGVEPTPTSAVRVAGGTTYSARVVWRLLTDDPTKRFRPLIRLTNSREQTWAYAEDATEYPVRGSDPRQPIVSEFRMDVPPATPPGIYQMEVGFQDAGGGPPLQASSVRVVPMLPGEQGARMGEVIVAPATATGPKRSSLQSVPSLPQAVNFSDRLRLLDLALRDGEALKTGRPGRSLATDSQGVALVAAGDVVHFDLLWQELGGRGDDLIVTARLASDDGFLWAVRDSQPADGAYPTSFWSADEVVFDQLNLAIPPETPPGRYDLQLEVIAPSGPLSILDASRSPLGPTMRAGALVVLPAPKPVARADTQPQHRADIIMIDGLVLLGYGLGRPELQPGDRLRVDLLWQAKKPIVRDVTMRLELVGGQGKEWTRATLKLGGEAFPTSRWRIGEVIRGQHDLTLPAVMPPGEAAVRIVLVDSASGGQLGQAQVGRVTVVPRARIFEAAPSHPLRKVLDGKIALLGFDLSTVAAGLGQARLAAGESQTIKVTLYWQALAEMSTNYTVFAQVLNSAGRLVAQHDAPPAGGRAPTAGWVRDEVVADEHTIAIPADLPQGDYALIVGVYDALTGKRLAVAGANDAIELTPLTLVAAR